MSPRSDERSPLRGFINVDKPRGSTSFDVVRQIRRAAGTRKVGHAGTLDPNATGVLPVAIGDATRLVDELIGSRKGYRATIILGRATDTYDAEGDITAEANASHVTQEVVHAALNAFRGDIMQTPPAYSAVKREGVVAYRAARRGEPLDLEPRPVVVYDLAPVSFDHSEPSKPALTLDVTCGKGFYVRSLAHDLGRAIGVGGYLHDLRRTRVGPFVVEDATSLDHAVAMLEAGETDHLVHAPDVVLTAWPAIILGSTQTARVRQGMDVTALPRRDYVRPDDPAPGVRSYGPSGELVALLRPGRAVGAWHPYRVFPARF
jgi:tRNA pseudouridine55 synthase